jgi:hypothetical protein
MIIIEGIFLFILMVIFVIALLVFISTFED